MLNPVQLEQRRFADYKDIIAPELFDEVKRLARQLSAKRILHLNATAEGGGVAEVLRSYVPLQVDLGINSSWQVLPANQDFFSITKMIHNGLQGDSSVLTLGQWDVYQDYNRVLAESIDTSQWDYIFIHDPQPASAISYCSEANDTKWIWRCHIDSRHATPDFVEHFITYLKPYDGLIFTLQKYLIPGLKPKHLAIIPMAIDPLSPKNLPMSLSQAHKLIEPFGINLAKPLVVQVSRFDPWKDPLGAIKSWQLAKLRLPDLQLALVGNASVDDPQSVIILEQVQTFVKDLSDVFVVANKADDRTVNAFQKAANVVLQKSLREGFGLTVSEALWAKTPVIGGKFGGIPEQVRHGQSGYLVDSTAEAANRIVELIEQPKLAEQMGQWGHDFVRKHFLLPRLVRDDLKFLLSL